MPRPRPTVSLLPPACRRRVRRHRRSLGHLRQCHGPCRRLHCHRLQRRFRARLWLSGLRLQLRSRLQLHLWPWLWLSCLRLRSQLQLRGSRRSQHRPRARPMPTPCLRPRPRPRAKPSLPSLQLSRLHFPGSKRQPLEVQGAAMRAPPSSRGSRRRPAILRCARAALRRHRCRLLTTRFAALRRHRCRLLTARFPRPKRLLHHPPLDQALAHLWPTMPLRRRRRRRWSAASRSFS
jgi:hypothetical protein